MHSFLQDIRFSLRVLAKAPGFTLAAVIALALGIGVNTATFSAADAYLIKPMPLPTVERLVAVLETRAGQTSDWSRVAPATYVDWARQTTLFERLSPYQWNEMNLSGQGEAERVLSTLVASDFFETLGARPLLGRTFTAEEDQPGREQVAVLGFGLWQRRCASDPAIVGKTIRLESKPYTVVGVMPKNFRFPVGPELWTPMAMDAKEKTVRNSRYLEVVGKLKPGVSVGQVRAEMETLSRRLAEAYPESNRGWRARVMPIREFMVGDLTRNYTIMLMYAVSFVLLIACANVANLQFARAGGRQKEIALRTALGASRWRVVRQLLTESMLLGLGGSVLGLLLAQWYVEMIHAYMPADVARFVAGWDQVQLDGRAFAYTVAVAMLAGIIAGLAPALKSSRPDLNETLKEGGRGSSTGRSRHRLHNVLLGGEVALALVLLMGAGLMVKGVRALIHVNRNMGPESLLTMRVSLPESKYKEAHQIANFYGRALDALVTVPGVETATLSTTVPHGNTSGGTSAVNIEGRPPAVGEVRTAETEDVSPNYFRTMHIALRDGRAFGTGDGANSTPVAIVSETLARRYWPGESALGRRIQMGATDSDAPWLTVVGVTEDVRYQWIDAAMQPVIYRPYTQAARPYAYLVVRSDDGVSLAGAVRRAVATVDPDLPVSDIKTLDRVISESVLGLSYVAVMMAVLGAMALVLACVGVYGVMAYAVTERTREIGIRVALGAKRGQVLRMVIAGGMLVTGIGLAVGFAMSMMLARVLSSLIFGVSATDWQTFGGISLALASSSFAACYLPARRAMRIDPTVALRYE